MLPGGPEHDIPSSAEHAPSTHRRRSATPLLGENELRGMLQGSVAELADELLSGTSDHLKQYLDFAARFHTYSPANQFLIYLQCPEATRVASYKKWQDEGYQVAKGQKSIRILAPTFQKVTNLDTGEEERIVRGFVAVSVFDASQLTPDKRPPEFFTPLEGDQETLCDQITAAATSDGFQIDVATTRPGVQGFSSQRRIVTREGLDSTSRALTLLHEWAHGVLHQGLHQLSEERRLSRALKECHAEATAYVVAKHLGLPAPFSTDYLLHWGTTPELLREEMDAVVKAAGHIIRAIHADLPAEATPHHPNESGDADPSDQL